MTIKDKEIKKKKPKPTNQQWTAHFGEANLNVITTHMLEAVKRNQAIATEIYIFR